MMPVDPIEEAIFNVASELADPQQRATFLDQACGANGTMRARIESLLKADVRAKQFLSDDPLDLQRKPVVAAIPVAHVPDESLGAMIGRYKLLEKIGEGGCGMVYVAEQQEPVRRRVALKVIKLGMDTRQVVARFEAERQALAMMDHPNIAKIFDAGITDAPHPASGHPLPSSDERRGQGAGGVLPPLAFSAGRPYFVMELVRGTKITEYCDQSNLPTRERLDLFIQVCQAVQHAHQKGIIHRDLKPSNILVTVNDGRAVPKIIDFGIAKATQGRLTDHTLYTAFQQVLGTPAYMSPEQALLTSIDIDTRSDIYSLGVLLYELLTGKTPFDAKELLDAGLDEMRRTIREKEPVRPSTRLSSMSPEEQTATVQRRQSDASKFIHLLRGDLDWIVMKCLEKDRARRYDTANGLAGDVQRHLASEAVVARPPSATYRLQKAIRRNKVGFAATVLVMLALATGTLVSAWQAVRAGRAERSARDQAVKATTAERTAREQAAKATQAEQKATQQAQIAKDQAELAKQNSERAKAVQDFLVENLLGGNFVYGTSPEPDAASFQATRVLVEKVARRVDGRFTNQPLTEADIRMTLGLAFVGFGEFANFATQAEKALEIRQRLLGPAHSDTLWSVATLAGAKHNLGRRKEAQKLLEDGMAVARTATNGWSVGGALVVGGYGGFLTYDGRPAEALPYLKESIALLKQTMDPKDLRIIQAMGGLAYATQWAGRWEDAEALWLELVQQCERDHGPDHLMTVAAQHGLARLWLEQQRWEKGLPLIERVISQFQQRQGTNHHLTLDAQCLLAQAYEKQGQIEDAARLYADLYPRWAKYLPQHISARGCCEEIAGFFVRHRRYEDAKAVYGPLREFFEANPPEDASDFETLVRATAATKGWPAVGHVCRRNFDSFSDSPWIWLNKAWIFRFVGDEEQYRQIVTNVLTLALAAKTLDDQRVVIEIAGLGPSEPSPDQVKQLDSLMQALQLAAPGGTTNQQIWSSRAIARLQLRLGRLQECLATLEKSAAEETRLNQGFSLMIKALCLHRSGNVDAARAAFDESEAIIMPTLPEPLSQNEGFMLGYQLNYLTLRREAQAVLAGTGPKP